MNHFGNFLWKLFSVTMVFLCHIGPNNTFAESSTTDEQTPPTQYIADDPKMTSDYFVSTTEVGNRITRTIRLCPSGQYLSGCGDASFGTNLLKGMKKTGDIKTPDYYSYDTVASDTIHMENLRKFFAHTEPINFRSQTELSNGNHIFADETVPASTYKTYLYQILSNFCTNKEGDKGDIHCSKCPNNASVESSTVKEDSYKTTKLLWDSWNVHTIADCYMNEFSDEEGTYIYVADNVQNDTNGTKCYYTKNIHGTSSLFYK